MELPDPIIASMLKRDITRAAAAMEDATVHVHKMSLYCPVAQMLTRLFPDYSWRVGYSFVIGTSASGEKHEYQLNTATKRWITRLPHHRKWGSLAPRRNIKAKMVSITYKWDR
jgi:hypothetical protein